MKTIKWEKKILAGLSGLCLAATALAISANTTAFAATSEQPLSPDNGYSVSVRIDANDPAYVGLDRVPAGDYILTVEPWYMEPDANPQFVATLDDGVSVSLERNEYMYGAYIGDFTISETSTQFKITTALQTDPETTINVSLYEKITPAALPTDAAHPATLEMYEEYNYEYTFEKESGYYTVNPNPSVENAQFEFMLKGDPNDFTGETIYDANYPVYLVKGKPYYFGVTCLGLPEGDQTVDVHFTFSAWTPVPVTANRAFYAPVTPATATKTLISTENLAARDYVLRIMQGPEVAYTSNILLHLVDSENNETTVPVEYGECNFTVTATTTDIYFTSDSKTTFVIGALINFAPSPSVNFTVGTSANVSMNKEETLLCYVANVTESGNYIITISNIKSGETALEPNPIEVSTSLGTIVIAQGETSGMFPIVLGYPDVYGNPGQTVKDEPLYFTNNYDGDVTFDVKIEKSTVNYDVTLGVATQLTAQPGESVTYFVPNLTVGTYLATLTDEAGNIVIYDYFDRYQPLLDREMTQNLYSFGNVTLEEGRTLTYAFVVENNGATAETFTVRFEKVDSIVLGEENTLTVEYGTYEYYLGRLTTGRYQVKLSDISEGALFAVNYNGVTVVSSVSDTGYFTVDVPAGQRDVLSRFSITNYNAAAVSFKITVTEVADGDMTLGTAQTVTLGYNDQTETYNIALEAGKYTLTLAEVPENVTVYVYANGEYLILEDNAATFEVGIDGTINVEFEYYSADSTITFSFTATITAATVEA